MIKNHSKRRLFALLTTMTAAMALTVIPVKATLSTESPPDQELETQEEPNKTEDAVDGSETEMLEEGSDEELQSETETPSTTDTDEEEEEPQLRDDLPGNLKDAELNNTGKAEVHEGNGYLLMEIHPHPSINGQPIYISFFDDTSYEEYNYILYPRDKYCMTCELPAGFYIVESGGSIYDTKGLFQPERKQFQIQAGTSAYIEIGVGIVANYEGSYEGDTSLIDVATVNEDGTVTNPEGELIGQKDENGNTQDITMIEQEQLQEEGTIESLGPQQIQEKQNHQRGIAGKIFGTVFTILVLLGAAAIAMKMRNDR